MLSMQPVAAEGDGPRSPKIVLVALATGYVAGYTAAFGIDGTANAAVQAVVGAAAWLLWRHQQ
ncbi:hypothetical protein [Streptomyces sp. SYP-A7185]|uniref:hypothetical protein n=1 Tax=Streptomyces sp. SYP-A7185 TaxID=3040076 RepID=UPI0038F75104